MKGKMLLVVGIMVLALGLVGTPASWASLLVDGITFSFSVDGSGNLVLDISGTGTGGYSGVNDVSAVALGKDTYGTATLATTATGGVDLTGSTYSSDNGIGGTFNNLIGAPQTGCATEGGPSFGTCFLLSSGSGTYTDHATITFGKTGGDFDASAVNLKFCFSKNGEFCFGSLVSEIVPGNGTSTPEPASLMLLGAGLAGIGIWRRKAIKA